VLLPEPRYRLTQFIWLIGADERYDEISRRSFSKVEASVSGFVACEASHLGQPGPNCHEFPGIASLQRR
jgi:hypothetical protein